MKILYLLITLCTTLVVYASLVCAQYNYIGRYTEAECKLGLDEYSSTSTYRGYSCSGDQSCNTNLTYRSQSGYSTLSDIANLLGVDPNTVSLTNPQYRTGIVGWNKLVYVPIRCSCPTGGWMSYFSSVTYTLSNNIWSYYEISNNTFQGLTTCQVLEDANPDYGYGDSINVPLRCACPTTSQKKDGVKSLTTYVVGTGDTISSISTDLNVPSNSILEVNEGLNKENATVFPFTTLLIPVMSDDNSTSESPTSSPSASLATGAIGGIVAAVCAALLAFAGVAYRFNMCGSICTYSKTIINYSKETKEKDQNGPRAESETNI